MTPTSESSDNLIYDDNEELKTGGATPEGINSDIKGSLGDDFLNLKEVREETEVNGFASPEKRTIHKELNSEEKKVGGELLGYLEGDKQQKKLTVNFDDDAADDDLICLEEVESNQKQEF